MHKRIRCILSVLLSIALLLPLLGCDSGSQEKPAYQYVDGNDGFDYVILNLDLESLGWLDEEGNLIKANGSIMFDSLEEMIQDLKTGNLTDMELYYLCNMEENEHGGKMIPDLDHLYEPVYPEDMEFENVWLEDEGEYCLEVGDVFIYVTSGEKVAAETEEYASFWEQGPIIQLSDPNGENMRRSNFVEEGNKTFEWYYKRFYYTLQTNEMIYYIKETYKVYPQEDNGEKLFTISMWAENSGGVFLYIHILGNDDTQSQCNLEWLASFGVKPYIPSGW